MLKEVNGHCRDKYITFNEEEHKYTIYDQHVDSPVVVKYSSTSFIGLYFSKFDADRIINNMMNSCYWKNNKYYNMVEGLEKIDAVNKIKNFWKENGEKAANDGTILHESIEDYYNKIFRENYQPEFKLFLDFHLNHQEYIPYRTEWVIYDEETVLAGTIDMVYYNPKNDSYVICDWKRSREIKLNAFKNAKAYEPINHVPDCNYYKYSLQVNLYKWMLEKNYGINVSELWVVSMHPNYDKYQKFVISNMQDEIHVMVDNYKKRFLI